MKIYFSTILFLLSKKYGKALVYKDFKDVSIHSVRLYSGDIISPNVLYIIKSATDLSTFNAEDSGFLFLSASPEFKKQTDKKPVAFLADSEDPSFLLEKLFTIINELYQWDNLLKDCLLNNTDLPSFFLLGENFIFLPFILIDRNFSIVAYSKNFLHYFENEYQFNFESSPNSRQIPLEQVEALVMNSEFHKVEYLRAPFIYPSMSCEETIFYCTNIFRGGEFICRFLIHLPKKINKIEAGQAHLINHYSSYLKELYKKFTGSLTKKHQNDLMHNLLRSLFIKEHKVSSQDIRNALKLYGWEIQDEYVK
jgi:hypothetical protein